MIRKPTFAGKIEKKDQLDIFFWAYEKSPSERLAESWRLNCINHNVPLGIRMKRIATSAKKRENG